MTKLTHFNHAGKKLEDLAVSQDLFAAKISPALMAQAVRVSMDRAHQHTSRTKRRGDVNLTTAKWFKQKGTGRARHGSQSAPIFVGGGVAHGPDGFQHFPKTLPVKMRRLSIIGALTDKAKNDKVMIISGLEKISNKTKELDNLLDKLNSTKKVLLLTAKPYAGLLKASSNINYLCSTHYQK